MIQVAVVGARGVGVSHVAALRQLVGVRVAMVVGSSAATAAAAAQALDVPRWSADWREAVSDDTIDAVHVCTPNDLHFPIAAAALAAGKHVVCEKPLSVDAAEARKLADLSAERPQLITVVGYKYRFAPLLQRLRQLVSDDRLGEVHEIRASYRQNWMLDPDASSWRRDAAQGGRHRVLLDIGTHLLDLMETVLGKPVARMYGQEFRLVQGGSDDGAQVLVRFRGGVLGAAAVSQVSAAHTHHLSITVDGVRGSARWTLDDVETLDLSIASETSRLRLDGAATHSRAGRYWHRSADPDRLLVPLLTAAYDRSVAPTFEDGARHLALIENLEPIA